MLRRCLTAVSCLAALSLSAVSAQAEERAYLGTGWLITNDQFGDAWDRWRTGSAVVSLTWGPDWTGQLPSQAGQILEFRLGAEVLSPENLVNPAATDRRYAGALSLGLHTHFERQGTEFSLGGDLVFTGPQTGLDDLQQSIHDVLGGMRVSQATRANQIGNDVHPSLLLEIGRDLSLSENASLRPFVEARVGVETLARIGADLTFGGLGRNDLMMRDGTTGHRYSSVRADQPGMAFVLGGDIATVDSSEYLPSSQGYQLTDYRTRLRAGIRAQSKAGHRAFYGLTWLDKEFKAQREGQIVGSIRLSLEF